MAKRTPEEIQAQREAFLAAKAARAAGQAPPAVEKPADPPPPPAEEPVAVAPVAPAAVKRTPEEVRAQREAFLAAKAAKAAGAPAPAAPPPAPQPVPAAPAAAPVAQPVEAAKPKPAPKAAAVPPPPAPKVETAPASHVTRREFLNYAWLASIVLFSVETIAASLWFAYPNIKAGEFGGEFPIGPANEALPEVNAPPKAYVDGKFWLSNVDTQSPDGQPRKGVLAIYKVCTHLGCLYEWIDMTNRFECPCHGSKFTLTADYLAGPARRSLDRFVVKAVGPDGQVMAQTDAAGNPLVINGDENLIVDTGQRILGAAVVTPA